MRTKQDLYTYPVLSAFPASVCVHVCGVGTCTSLNYYFIKPSKAEVCFHSLTTLSALSYCLRLHLFTDFRLLQEHSVPIIISHPTPPTIPVL